MQILREKINHSNMATSIFFTESKDFKLIKDQILSLEDDYLVYVYADTTNVRIPKELIMRLPKYGNNLIWVDTAEMEVLDLSQHIVLTVGQLMNHEEEIIFYIVSKSSKLEKTVAFLKKQNIPVELIAPEFDKSKASAEGIKHRGRPKKIVSGEAPVKTGKRGRPKKQQPVTESTDVPVKTGKRGRPKKQQSVAENTDVPVKTGKRGRPKKVVVPSAENIEVPQKKRGRPRKAEQAVEATAEPKKRGRKRIVRPESEGKEKKSVNTRKNKKGGEIKEPKIRKPRVDKEITEEMIQEKLALYTTTDSNLSTVMTKLFSLKKVARPKFTAKLIDLIKLETLEDDTVAESIVNQLQEMQVLESTGPSGRVYYKD